jgi:hypothetical protein
MVRRDPALGRQRVGHGRGVQQWMGSGGAVLPGLAGLAGGGPHVGVVAAAGRGFVGRRIVRHRARRGGCRRGRVEGQREAQQQEQQEAEAAHSGIVLPNGSAMSERRMAMDNSIDACP